LKLKPKNKFSSLKLFSILLLFLFALPGAYYIFFKGEKKEWIMPNELSEISGISFLDDHTLACVQDEKGFIFLYDLKNSEITKRIKFAGKGDYEGISLVGNTAYVITGEGTLYEVNDFLTDPKVNTYYLNLKSSEESEAICYDHFANRLLLAFKNNEKDSVAPGIFAFDLNTKTMIDSSIIKVDLQTVHQKKKDRGSFAKLWEPADIAIDAVNQKILVTDAINGHLLTLSMNGGFEKITPIGSKKIEHPEGISVGSDGSIFICNDANTKGKGKIVKFRDGGL
jgi:uncharacterized protein YjiK